MQKIGEHGDVDIHFLSTALWKQMLYDNNVHALTCECLPPAFVLRRPQVPHAWSVSLMRLKHQVYRYAPPAQDRAQGAEPRAVTRTTTSRRRRRCGRRGSGPAP